MNTNILAVASYKRLKIGKIISPFPGKRGSTGNLLQEKKVKLLGSNPLNNELLNNCTAAITYRLNELFD